MTYEDNRTYSTISTEKVYNDIFVESSTDIHGIRFIFVTPRNITISRNNLELIGSRQIFSGLMSTDMLMLVAQNTSNDIIFPKYEIASQYTISYYIDGNEFIGSKSIFTNNSENFLFKKNEFIEYKSFISNVSISSLAKKRESNANILVCAKWVASIDNEKLKNGWNYSFKLCNKLYVNIIK